jgi:N6-adenosine-specific RNA methylase IME4
VPRDIAELYEVHEHRRLSRYGIMTLDDILASPITELAAPPSHLYLWVPNALLPEGIAPDELYELVEACSWGPFLELFARGAQKGRSAWGDQADDYAPSWTTYANHSQSEAKLPAASQVKPADSLKALRKRKRANAEQLDLLPVLARPR